VWLTVFLHILQSHAVTKDFCRAWSLGHWQFSSVVMRSQSFWTVTDGTLLAALSMVHIGVTALET